MTNRESLGCRGAGAPRVVVRVGALAAAIAVGCSGSQISSREQPAGGQPPAEGLRGVPDDMELLLGRMTLEEKLGQLSQYGGSGDRISEQDRERVLQGRVGSFLSVYGAQTTRELQRLAVEQTRLHIPLLFAYDVIHGYRTVFPVGLAEAATFNPEAAERAARVAATEAAAAGIHWTFSPMVDVGRDPRWGRIVEGVGEDPYLGEVLAAARVRGFQGNDPSAPDAVLACAKHFVAYGAAEGGRDYNTTDMSEQTLRDVYLPPFRAAVQAGAATLMSSFNEISGVPASANPLTLNQILRKEWNFAGVVVSDWTSVAELVPHGFAADRAAAGRLALTAGVDIDMSSGIYGDLAAEVRAGRLSMEIVDRAVYRVLSIKEMAGLFQDPYRKSDVERERRAMLTPEHRQAAREVSRESIVLLGNRTGLLPLSRSLRTIAVIGPLASDGDSSLGPWAMRGVPSDTVTIVDGIKRAVPQAKVVYQRGIPVEGTDPAGLAAAVRAARGADAVVLVVGESREFSGEARSRAALELPGAQLDLVRKVVAANPHTAVLLMNGRPLAIPELAAEAPALLEIWFLGTEIGSAVADVLFGEYNPSGKLPVSFPAKPGQIPVYYNHKNTGRPPLLQEEWTSKYFDAPVEPLYAFGHGLSYTRFSYSALRVSPAEVAPDGEVAIEFELANTGDRAGMEIAQLYVRDAVGSTTRPVQELKGFARVPLKPGERRRVRIDLPVSLLGFHGADGRLAVEPGEIRIQIGSSSADIRLRGQFRVTGERTPVADRTVFSRASHAPI